MSRVFHSKKVTVLAVIGLLLVAGGAYAYWTQAGAGSGTVTTGTSTALTILQTSTMTPLTPGATAQPLSGTITNPGTGTVHVTGVTAALQRDWPPSRVARLPTTRSPDPVATVNLDVAGGASTTWSGPTIRMVNSGTDQEGCKNAVVTVTYTSNSQRRPQRPLVGTRATLVPGAFPLPPVRRLLVILLVAPLLLGGVAYATYSVNDARTPQFTLRVTPSAQTIFRGSTMSASVDLSRADAFRGPVRLRVIGLPARVTARWQRPDGGRHRAPYSQSGRCRAHAAGVDAHAARDATRHRPGNGAGAHGAAQGAADGRPPEPAPLLAGRDPAAPLRRTRRHSALHGPRPPRAASAGACACGCSESRPARARGSGSVRWP